MTFPTSTVLDTLRFNSSKPWLMVSIPSGRRILNCKRSTECKFVLLSTHFPTTSKSLLENCKKNRKCHLSDFLMSLKMFKKSSKNSKIIFFTTYFSSSYPMLNMSMHVWLFFPWERQQPERGRLLLPQSCKKLFKNRRK